MVFSSKGIFMFRCERQFMIVRGNDGRYSIRAKQAESVRCENQTAHIVAKRT